MMARSSKAPSTGRIQKSKTDFSKSSLSACNARPVHTDGPQAEVAGLFDYLVGAARLLRQTRLSQTLCELGKIFRSSKRHHIREIGNAQCRIELAHASHFILCLLHATGD